MDIVQFWQTLCLFSLGILRMCVGIAIEFPNKDPLYVALGRTLVLEAQFQLKQNERISLRTWEHKNSEGEVRVADGDKTYNNRTSVEKNGALLRIKGVVKNDIGLYKVTVTTSNGDQVSAARQVLEITNPPKASLSMQCSVSTEGAQWDSPSFLWIVDGVSITNKNETSEDGSVLRSKTLGQNYTCITDSSHGTSQAELYREPSAQTALDSCQRGSCTALIICLVIETIILVLMIGYWVYMSKKSTPTESARRDQTL
ncbi:uncharacterized protein LOC113647200 isoform X2 [Tachysurus fulvidraco]|nr:uncharacterized protein LOC113647200 isoform X2 [Tachysurus fulvidraco]